MKELPRFFSHNQTFVFDDGESYHYNDPRAIEKATRELGFRSQIDGACTLDHCRRVAEFEERTEIFV